MSLKKMVSLYETAIVDFCNSFTIAKMISLYEGWGVFNAFKC